MLWLPFLALAAVPGPSVREVHLDPDKPQAIYQVVTSVNVSTTIQLPEPWLTPPTCGSCVFGQSSTEASGELFRIDLVKETNSLIIKPIRHPGPDLPVAGYITTLNITLESGLTVSVYVRLDFHERADARVDFTIPKGETAAERTGVLERKLRQKFAARVRDAAELELLRALSERNVRCKSFFGFPKRAQGLLVRLRQICATARYVILVAELDNRTSRPISIGSLTVSGESGPVSSRALIPETLGGGERKRVAGLVEAPGKRPDTWTLEIEESGGKERVLTVKDIEF